MRIGVICEGPTDYFAITYFLAVCLEEAGVTPQFVSLFPEMDKTRPDGGWANVLLWLNRNLPDARVQRYFGGGLFGGALSTEPLDAIILQLDSDIIGDELFQLFVRENYKCEIQYSEQPEDRAKQIGTVLEIAAKLELMTDADRKRHVITPAVEATEAWCVAVFNTRKEDFESLKGKELIDAFMIALERSEGREPQKEYACIDKNINRRKRFCEKHSAGSRRIAASCPHFASALAQLTAITPATV